MAAGWMQGLVLELRAEGERGGCKHCAGCFGGWAVAQLGKEHLWVPRVLVEVLTMASFTLHL